MNEDKEDGDMVRRAAITVTAFVRASQTMPGELKFAMGVVVGAALRNVPLPLPTPQPDKDWR